MALRYWPRVLIVAGASALYGASHGLFLQSFGPLLEYLGINMGDVQREHLSLLRQYVPSWIPLPVDGNLPLEGLAILLPLLGLLIVTTGYLRSLFSGDIIWKTVRDLRQALCDRLLTHPVEFFEKSRTGELISRMLIDVDNARASLDFLFNAAFFYPFMIAFGVGYCFHTNTGLALLTLTLLPFLMRTVTRLGKKIRASSRYGLEKIARVTDALQQTLTGMRVVKAFQMEDRERREFASANAEFYKQMIRIIGTRAASSAVIDSTGYLLAPLFLIAVAWTGSKGWIEVNPNELFVFGGFLMTMVFKPLRSTIKDYNQLQESLPGAQRVFEILESSPGIQDAPDAAPFLANGRASVRFEKVSFSYGQGPVLQGIDFEVAEGETVAVIGPSGAGKSTLLDLIPRFYDPTEGRVMINRQDVRKMIHRTLLERIAVVGQDTFLFNTSIRENIRFGRPGANDAEVEEASQGACLEDLVRRLPQGLDTGVGERGVQLSGGERQRIAIARAMLRDPTILLLDEATSELDTHSENRVQVALRHLMRGRTTFVIAHRLSTVRHADRILVLNKGRLVESGNHQELINRNGLYRYLHDLQLVQAE
jgi:subfamily B ATP-binding cassette protein MsbA